MWQDKVIAVVCIIFAYGNIPTIMNIYRQKNADNIHWQTAGISFFGLCTVAFCMWTLKLYLTCVTDIIVAMCWLIIGTQKIIYSKKIKGE